MFAMYDNSVVYNKYTTLELYIVSVRNKVIGTEQKEKWIYCVKYIYRHTVQKMDKTSGTDSMNHVFYIHCSSCLGR